MSRFFNRRSAKLAGITTVALAGLLAFAADAPKKEDHSGPQQPWSKWKVHDMDRPTPPIITPGTASTPEAPGKPPSDAVVLFDGKDLSKWQAAGGGEPTFTLKDGFMLSTNLANPKNNKYLESKDQFGDVQLHVEWSTPTPAQGTSQGRGNSGVFLMGKFEIQVLDSFDNVTYADGQASAVYGQYPPQVNVCRPPGEWQTYDIIFHRPRYAEGKLASPAYITVLQNGVLTQDHQEIHGPTGHKMVAKYPDKFPEAGPISLQFHGNPVRYRNIWVRPLEALEHQQQTGEVAGAPAPKPVEAK